MKKLILILILFALVGKVSAGGEISGCDNIISSGLWNLTADIKNSTISRCINLTANDLIFDCQGHLIDGDDDADYGMYILGNNVTVKNCRISDWDANGIRLITGDGNVLKNINISSCPDYGIQTSGSNNNKFYNITFNASGLWDFWSVDGINCGQYFENVTSDRGEIKYYN